MSNATHIAEKFPYARYHEGWKIITWHPNGVLDDERADRMVEYLETEAEADGAAFHRFTDLSGYARIQIGLDHIVRLARRRKQGYKGPPVKSAFYAVRLIGLSIARMYEELMHGSRIEICTFRDRAAAADWLGVPAAILQPPRTESK